MNNFLLFSYTNIIALFYTCFEDDDWLKLWNDLYLTSDDFPILLGRDGCTEQTNPLLSFEDGNCEYDADIVLTGKQKSFWQCVHFIVVHVECKGVVAFKNKIL